MSLTRQQIFDRVAVALIAQGKAAARGRSCRYRLGDLKCAAGHLIADEDYSPDMEGVSVPSIPTKTPGHILLVAALNNTGVANEDLNLVNDLQIAHDHNLRDAGLDSWREAMIVIANRNNLDATSVHP